MSRDNKAVSLLLILLLLFIPLSPRSGYGQGGAIVEGQAAGGSLAGTYPNPTLGSNTVGSSQITDGTVAPADVSLGSTFSFTDLAGKQKRNSTAINDSDCTGEEGNWWYDTTAQVFRFCEAANTTPSTLCPQGNCGSGSPGSGISELCLPAPIDNPATVSCTGTLGEFCTGWYFRSASTITRLRAYVVGGTSIQFTAYECTVGTNCTAPTLSSQGLNGATLTTATTTPANDDAFTNASIAAGNEVWIHVDKSTEVGSVTILSVFLCFSTP